MGHDDDPLPDLIDAGRDLRDHVDVVGAPVLDAVLPVSRLSASVFAAVGTALAALLGDGARPVVDRGLADAWFGMHARPVGRAAPSPWDPLSGAFPTHDGSWIRTHANAPHHRAALLAALDLPSAMDTPPEVVAGAVAARGASELEAAIVAHGGTAAALRSPAEWDASAAGRAVATEPTVAAVDGPRWGGRTAWAPTPEHPLAGPVATGRRPTVPARHPTDWRRGASRHRASSSGRIASAPRRMRVSRGRCPRPPAWPTPRTRPGR